MTQIIIISVIAFLVVTLILVGLLLFAKAKLTPSGTVKININNEFGGLCLTYRIINGEEDKVVPLVPEEKELLDDNFDLLFNTEEE